MKNRILLFPKEPVMAMSFSSVFCAMEVLGAYRTIGEEKAIKLLEILNSHFALFGNWNEEFRAAKEQLNLSQFLAYAEHRLMNADLSLVPNSYARENIEVFQYLASVYGYSNVKMRVLGFLLETHGEVFPPPQRQCERRSVQSQLGRLRVDIINGPNRTSFPGHGGARSQKNDDNSQIRAVRPQIFQDGRGLPRYNLKPIDKLATKVAFPQ